jgi:catechol 2,3-dioxygenase-like lactoylglutathione lyase family enzyme
MVKATLQAVRPVLMVRDVTASLRFYAQLGFQFAFADSNVDPKYAGVRRDDVELHFQWHAAEDFSSGDRPNYRFLVPEVDALSVEFSSRQLELDRTDVSDTPWGTREFHLRDPDRNGLQFYRLL